jgi:uncharacterized membrane protein
MPRAVPVGHVFGWFEQAMRLFKRAPWTWCALGLITVVAELLLNEIPVLGVAMAKVIVPVLECGMLIGAVAVDRGAPLKLRVVIAAFAAPPAALAAIIVSALLIFAAESLAAWSFAGINLLDASGDAEFTAAQFTAVLAVGTAASLPMMFVPFAALFDEAGFATAFASSARALARNIAPLVVFAALALVLVLIGLLAYGVGLIAIFPLVNAASYAAWKDVYAVPAEGAGPGTAS